MGEWVTCRDVVEILDKWEKSFGIREGRESWSNKSTDEQDKEIEEFKDDLRKINILLDENF